jgi:TetR/AcrR family transcriptional repressor of nem operon
VAPSRNAKATQQRLLDAALEFYAERGYAGTCLDAILQRASSSKGAFYHHFDSKEALTAKALGQRWEDILSTVKASRQGDTPQRTLELLIERLEPEFLRCPLGLLGFESPSLPEQVKKALKDGLERWSRELIEVLLELGVKESAEARMLAEQLFVMYEGGVLVGRMSSSRQPLAAALHAWQAQVTSTTAS